MITDAEIEDFFNIYAGDKKEANHEEKYNILAVSSFISSILGLFFIIPSIAGVILGHISLKQFKTQNFKGKNLAIIGLTISYITILGFTIILLSTAVMFIVAGFYVFNNS